CLPRGAIARGRPPYVHRRETTLVSSCAFVDPNLACILHAIGRSSRLSPARSGCRDFAPEEIVTHWSLSRACWVRFSPAGQELPSLSIPVTRNRRAEPSTQYAAPIGLPTSPWFVSISVVARA